MIVRLGVRLLIVTDGVGVSWGAGDVRGGGRPERNRQLPDAVEVGLAALALSIAPGVFPVAEFTAKVPVAEIAREMLDLTIGFILWRGSANAP